MPLNLIFTQPGNFTIEDNGIPGDNTSVIKDGTGTVIFTFIHPADSLGFTVSTPGVNLTINITDSLGAADFTIGSLTNPAASPDSVVIRKVGTSGDVTIVANGSITEGGSDAAADIVAGTLIMSAGSGVGTAGNAIETQTGMMEAETAAGGINISNFGSVQIGGLTDQVNGLDVLTSGNLTLTALGSIFLSDIDLDLGNLPGGPFESVHGGNTSGNVTLTALGSTADIIANVDTDAISASRGSITLNAGRDVAFGIVGVDFDNDVRASGGIVVNAGRDFLIDGFADLVSDDFAQGTGGDVTINAGRNIFMRNIAGTDASILANGNAGADVILTTGTTGSVILDAPTQNAVSSISGSVVVNADRMLIAATSGITATAAEVTIRPATVGWEMLLGSATDAAFAVELSDAELDRIFTPSLIIGSNSAGNVEVISELSPANAAGLTIRSGANVSINSGITTTNSVTLVAGDDVLQLGGVILTGTFAAQVDAMADDGGVGGFAYIGTVSVTGTPTASSILINGNADADTLRGVQGFDQTVHGFGGNDTITSSGEGHYFGDSGDDLMFAGLSTGLVPEVLDGGAGTDTLNTTLYSGSYTINMATGVTNFAYESLVNFENLISGDGADTITGTSGANEIATSGGIDTVNAGAGNDIVSGGADGDTLDGGTGFDILDYRTSIAAVTVNLATNSASGGHAAGDVISNFEGVWGSPFGDTLTGNAGNNEFRGYGGNDTLSGGGGFDVALFGSRQGVEIVHGVGGMMTVTGPDGTDTLTGIELMHFEGTGKASFGPPSSWTTANSGTQGWHVGDFNGDGRDDVFRYVPGVSGADMFLSNGSSFDAAGGWTGAGSGTQGWHVGDFNGDGRDDVFRYVPGVSGADMFLSDGSSFDAAGGWTGAGSGTQGWHVGDFNGDGRDDVFRFVPGISGAEVFLSNGTGFVHSGSWTGAGSGTQGWHVGDFDGDGKDDIFRYVPGVSGADVFLSSGTAFVHSGSWTGAGSGSEGWYLGDFTGDGTSDLMHVLPGGADVLI